MWSKKKDTIILTAPTILKDSSIYIDKLKRLIKNKDVRNLALTGDYGTGKSSIIKTFIGKKTNKYIVITIGSFLKIDKCKRNENVLEKEEKNPIPLSQEEKLLLLNNTLDQSTTQNLKLFPDDIQLVDAIEKSILKQLIYRNYHNDLPDSNLKRIKKNKCNFLEKLLFTYFTYFLFISILFSYINKHINGFIYIFPNNLPIFSFHTIKVSVFVLLSLFTLSSVFVIYHLISKIINISNIKKIKAADYEVEFISKKDSTFTKQLYEIIYFFTKKRYRAVFFEDIDRFDPEIVLKVAEDLKELNNIINSSAKRFYDFRKKKITFVYSFRDDIFPKMQDKSKFYDYTLSVMPIATKYNSIMFLESKLKDINMENKISKLLLSITTKYIIDVRTLINIVNDFQLFQNKLDSNQYDKIFALAVYKNYDIKGYGKILSEENDIDKFLKSIENKRKELLKDIDKKIEDLVLEIEGLKNNVIQTKKDLKGLFLTRNMENCTISRISIGNNVYKISNFLNDNFNMDDFFNRKVFLYGDGVDLYEPSIFESFGSKEQFKEKYLKINPNLQEKTEELEMATIQKKNIESYTKKQLLGYYYMEDENSNLTHNKTLLSELISNDFIDESYIDYITLPVSNSILSVSESKYIFYVQHEEYNPNIPLMEEHIDKILEYLEPYITIQNILNFDLITYLVNNKVKYRNELESIMNQFKILNDAKLDFLYQYQIKYKNKFELFIQELINNKIDLWGSYINSKFIKNKSYRIFLHDVLLHSKGSISIMSNKNEFIETLINVTMRVPMQRKILDKDISTIETVQSNIKELNIRFPNVSELSDNSLDFIYKNNLYQFTKANINSVLKTPLYLDFSELNKYDNGFYFLNYVKTNFQLFGEEFYLEHTEFIINDPAFLKKILTESEISKDIVVELYEREEFKIDIKDIKYDLYDLSIEYNHIYANWTNVKKLLLKTENTKKIIQFILFSKHKLLTLNNVNSINTINQDFIAELLEKLITNSDYTSAKVILKTVHASNIKYKKIKKYNLKQLEFLTKNNLIAFNLTNLNFIKIYLDAMLITIYLINWYEYIGGIKKLFNIFKDDYEIIDILLTIPAISNNDKMIILNELWLKNKNKTELYNKFRLAFKANISYVIEYKLSIYRNVILNLKEYLSYTIEENKRITFKLEYDNDKINIYK